MAVYKETSACIALLFRIGKIILNLRVEFREALALGYIVHCDAALSATEVCLGQAKESFLPGSVPYLQLYYS